jgi:hypothetical protein
MTSTGYWWLALLLGLVVAVVAVVLLQILLGEVHRVERAAEQVWQAGKEVAANTANTWVLDETVHQLDLLTEEAREHERLLRGAATGGAAGDGAAAGGGPR